MTELASLGAKKDWDYLDSRRVRIPKGGSVNRIRPAFLPGWKATFFIQVILPEYIDQHLLHDVITCAGKFCGLAEFRPTFGRFIVTEFKVENF